MKIENFIAGEYKQQYQYKSFSPNYVNQTWTWDDPETNILLEEAAGCLRELNAYSRIIPDVDLFIKMHIFKEATDSSRIEGTQTHIDEALMEAEQITPEKRDDWQEVQNYVAAMSLSIKLLESLPLSQRLLKDAHKVLLSGVRGERKAPGEFRQSQNWIGGTNLQTAFFIPPHYTEINDLMSDLEKFWHNDSIHVPLLIKIAISHYQFETIHPFLDGNGRMGRLLITLFLIQSGMLSKPTLYLSDYLEKHKGAYYDALTVVRGSNNLIHWVRFFLTAIIKTSEKARKTFEQILDLSREIDSKIVALGRRAELAKKLINLLYSKPVLNIEFICLELGIQPSTANSLVKELQKLEILKEVTGFKRNRIFAFAKYINLFSN